MTAERPERASAIRFIVCLGVVSLFADMTYEGAYSILGPFLKDLGATAAQVAIIAGLGEMIAASLRLFSGRLADRTGAYWSIAIFGYALNLLVVPALAFAQHWWTAAALVVIERTGKSLRGPARDVLLSEATSEVGHGWGFGLHAAFDQTGAVLGPLLMIVVLSAGILVSALALPLAFLGGRTAVIASVGCWALGLGVQDASLRSGIAQVVSMNKRGGAFGAFNAVYGVMWFLGSAAMGLMYAHSLAALVAFGVAAQLAAAVMFFRLRAPLAEAAIAAS